MIHGVRSMLLPFLPLGFQNNGLPLMFFFRALCWRSAQGSLGSSSRARVLSPGWMRPYALRFLGREAAGLCSLCSSSYAAKPHRSERVSRRGPIWYKWGARLRAGLDAGASGDYLAWPFRRKNSRGQVEAMGSSAEHGPARRTWRREKDEPGKPNAPAQSHSGRKTKRPTSERSDIQGAWGALPTSSLGQDHPRRQASMPS